MAAPILETFAAGETCYFRSGGAGMTIQEVQGVMVYCVWMTATGVISSCWFNAVMLTHTAPKP